MTARKKAKPSKPSTRKVATKALAFPKIGSTIKATGGAFAGFVARRGGDYALIIGRELDPATSDDQLVAAKACSDGGFTDWDVGSRADWSVCKGNVPQLFKPEWHWTNEQHASNSDYAYFQYFGYGTQRGWGKYGKLRARLVRRLPISQFITLLGSAK